MRKPETLVTLAAMLLSAAIAGCQTSKKSDAEYAYFDQTFVASNVEFPDVISSVAGEEVHDSSPRTLQDGLPQEFWDLNFDQVLGIALQNSEVLQNVGGRVLTAPDSSPTVFDPAIRTTDPLYGTAGALSQFDQQLSTGLFWEDNNRAANTIISDKNNSGGARETIETLQNLGTLRTDINKIAITGSRFSLSNFTTFDESRRPGFPDLPDNLFPSAWDTRLEAGVRHPFLQGGGTTFNRIAGPNAQPGFNFSSGYFIAKVNSEISSAEFEGAVADFVSQLEDAYWDLYFAYRDLEAKSLARDGALKTWQSVEAKFKQKLLGGEADKEAQARAQYYFFEDQVQDALSGSPLDGRSVGIYRGERRLRQLMGLPTRDGQLIRPSDEPSQAKIVFAWDEALGEALSRRIELRRQALKIERRQMELIAARNFTKPRLDGLARYRWRGFGDQLFGDEPEQYASALKDFASGDHQEWSVGMEFQMPLGFRQGWAGVRNAELQLAREHAILKQQELAVSYALSDAIAEVVRAYASVQMTANRLEAAEQRRDATEAALLGDQATLDLLLDAQQRLADAQTSHFQSLAQYAKAVKNVHREKGSLLENKGVYLNDAGWPDCGGRHAHNLDCLSPQGPMDYRLINQVGATQESLPTDVENAPQPREFDLQPLPDQSSVLQLDPIQRVLQQLDSDLWPQQSAWVESSALQQKIDSILLPEQPPSRETISSPREPNSVVSLQADTSRRKSRKGVGEPKVETSISLETLPPVSAESG